MYSLTDSYRNYLQYSPGTPFYLSLRYALRRYENILKIFTFERGCLKRHYRQIVFFSNTHVLVVAVLLFYVHGKHLRSCLVT